jgi:hypothetical protein
MSLGLISPINDEKVGRSSLPAALAGYAIID